MDTDLRVRWRLRVRMARRVLGVALLVLPMAAHAQFNATNEWVTPLRSRADSTPAISRDGTIYLGTFDGKLHSLSPTGVDHWAFQVGSEIVSSPAIAEDGTIYFGCRDRKFYAVTSAGLRKWTFKTHGWVDSSPAIATDGTVYFGSWDKTFYALAPDGSLKWSFPTAGEIDSSPAVDSDGVVYFGSHDGKFYALGPDGKKRWEFKTGGPVISSPAIGPDGALYFTSVDGTLYALNPGGTPRWKLRTGGITQSSPVLASDGTVYVGVNTNLWSVTAQGKKNWERAVENYIRGTPLALDNGFVCSEADFGTAFAVDAAMRLQWMFYVYGGPEASLVVSDSGIIYATYGLHSLTAIKPNPPLSGLSHSSWPKFRGNSRNTGNVRDNGH